MQKSMKSFNGLRLLVFILIFAALLLSMGTNRASAETQKKSTYLIKVNRVYNTVTVYGQDDGGAYTVPVKAMLCSVGKSGWTTKGTFKTKGKYRWKALMGDVWGQYATRIVGGILFHSVYYYEKNNPATLATKEFNKLGEAASHGCIRLTVEDAKWIYDNCSLGTTVIVYDDKDSPGPLGKPEGIKIASNVRWDPTDLDEKNPFLAVKPTISGIKSCKVNWGGTFDMREGLKAISSVGTDITSEISVKGGVDTTLPGKYKITYSVTDALNKSTTKTITVTVLNNTVAPDLKGIGDRVVNSMVTLDSDFLLTNVDAYCAGIKLGKDLIGVTIDKISDLEYDITYIVSAGNGPEAIQKSKVFIDDEAPSFTGIADSSLEEGEIPSKAYAMTGVSVSDNFSALENIIVKVSFTENSDGTYLVTYSASDEAGNTAIEEAVISN